MMACACTFLGLMSLRAHRRHLRRRAHRRSAGPRAAVRHDRAAGRDLSVSARGAARHHQGDAAGPRLLRVDAAGLVHGPLHVDGRGQQLPRPATSSRLLSVTAAVTGAGRPRQPGAGRLDGPARPRGAHARARQRPGDPRPIDRPAVGTRDRRAKHVRVRRGQPGAESSPHDPAGDVSRPGDRRRRAEARSTARLPRRPSCSIRLAPTRWRSRSS